MTDLQDRLAAMFAAHRHGRLGVTYDRKRVSVMAVDIMLADEVLAIPQLQAALQLMPVVKLGHTAGREEE